MYSAQYPGASQPMSKEYTEGPEARKNFEEGMKALFKVSKDEVVKAEKRQKKQRASRAAFLRKPTLSDKD
jgi:hypothetical protein